MLQEPKTCFHVNYNISLVAGNTKSNVRSHPLSMHGEDQLVMTGLEKNMRYNATIVAENEYGFSSTSNSTIFCTYNIIQTQKQIFAWRHSLFTCVFSYECMQILQMYSRPLLDSWRTAQ